MKNLFSYKWLQTKDHTQNKNFKISQNDWYKCREKKFCDAWPNESRSKVMFLMNCQKCLRWLEMRKAALMKNWWHFLKTKYSFWLMSFFRHHFRLTWVTFLMRRICCWCIVQQLLWKKLIKIMKKLNSNKTFKSNNITNWFLKVCEIGLINVLISFFQTCVNQKYETAG